MNQSFFTGAIGAYEQMRSLNVQGNNIANVNTVGFKAEKTRFSSLIRQNLKSAEETEQSKGVGARLWMTSTDHSQGELIPTGRAQDYTIDGDGYFAVVDLETNDVTFTRNGSFNVTFYDRTVGQDNTGNVVTETVMALTDQQGRFVLGTNGNIITVTDPEAPQNIGIFDYNNYDGMLHQSGTQFLPADKNGGLYYGTGVLVQKTLEGSNVDLAESMTKVIEAQRAYSTALKIVQTSDEIETTINGLR